MLTHYFQPGREDFRRTLQAAMPALLSKGEPTRDEQMREILEKSTAKSWPKDRKRLLDLLVLGILSQENGVGSPESTCFLGIQYVPLRTVLRM